MSGGNRFLHFLYGLLMLLGDGIMLLDPDDGYLAVIFLLDAAILLAAVRLLVFYLLMARHMVGGLRIFYQGIILLDLGIFMFTMEYVPQTIAMLYLAGTMGFSGLLGFLRALEAKRLGARSWRWAFLSGVSRLGLAVISLFFLHSVQVMTVLYCVGLTESAIRQIAISFRPTAIVYVGS